MSEERVLNTKLQSYQRRLNLILEVGRKALGNPEYGEKCAFFQSMCKKIEKIKNKFEANISDSEILCCGYEPPKPAELKSLWDKFDIVYFEIDPIKDMLEIDLSPRHSAVRADKDRASALKMPAIQLPIFIGDVTLWQSFYDLFLTLVYNDEQLYACTRIYRCKGKPVPWYASCQ
ncbi:hypothetical protein PR048_026654 [Dryococelus australis]|uniref:Uncharacterized protein n=1 Tax=Dryococelus australis TaxID=614101 RepID=A0ABQ9GM01_9NEOP|nr:hypothetical protein PR048_026654 [Dryococelus australis]